MNTHYFNEIDKLKAEIKEQREYFNTELRKQDQHIKELKEIILRMSSDGR